MAYRHQGAGWDCENLALMDKLMTAVLLGACVVASMQLALPLDDGLFKTRCQLSSLGVPMVLNGWRLLHFVRGLSCLSWHLEHTWDCSVLVVRDVRYARDEVLYWAGCAHLLLWTSERFGRCKRRG